MDSPVKALAALLVLGKCAGGIHIAEALRLAECIVSFVSLGGSVENTCELLIRECHYGTDIEPGALKRLLGLPPRFCAVQVDVPPAVEQAIATKPELPRE